MVKNDLGVWNKIALLVWKNCCCQWNNRQQFMASLLTPMIFTSILVVQRFMNTVDEYPESQHKKINPYVYWNSLVAELVSRKERISAISDFTYSVFVPRIIVAYAPDRYEAFNNIMSSVSVRLNNVEIIGFSSCQKLRENMMVYHYLAGVCFDDKIITMAEHTESLHLIGIYPNQLNYTIIFPNELRIYNDTYIGANWNTDLIFETIETTELRVHSSDDGGYVGYIREGFIALQHAVSTSYISLTAQNFKLPEVFMQRFPHPKHTYDRMTQNVGFSLSLIILIAYQYPIMHLTKCILEEKETELMVILKITGCPIWTQLCAWFIIGFVTMLVSTIIFLFMLTIHWHNGYSIVNSSYCALLFFMVAYITASVCYSLMIASFFKCTQTAVAASGILWFITYLPYVILVRGHTSKPIMMAMCFFSNTVMALTFENIIILEQNNDGFTWSRLFESSYKEDRTTIGMYILVLYVISIIYVIIGLSVEIFRPYLHMCGFLKKFKKFIRRNRLSNISDQVPPNHMYRKSNVYEIASNPRSVIVTIKDLQKIHDDVVILNNISLYLYENEITILMGPNGSGKSILISMLGGIITPTAGTVTFVDYNIHTPPYYANGDIGICMANGVLFQGLSVTNQLTFFCRLKGLNAEETESEVKKYLTAMKLKEYRNTVTKHLTNGQRKHLAVCCALTGDSKFVLLDNPSSGMDTSAMKLLWKMLLNEKQNRTILVATNSDQEAEALANRIIILSDGEIMCTGSTAFIKSFYGGGYKLVCVKGNNCETKNITELLQKHIPNITPKVSIGNQTSYSLQERNIPDYHKILDELTEKSEELNLISFSISAISFGDIFLKMSVDDIEGKSQQYKDILYGISKYYDEYTKLHFASEKSRLTGFKLWFNHFQAILLKRFLYDFRYKTLNAIQILFPIFILSLPFFIPHLFLLGFNLHPITYSLNQYTTTVSVIDNRPKQSSITGLMSSYYESQVFWLDIEHKAEDTGFYMFASYLIRKQLYSRERVNHRYLVGGTFGLDYVIAWFNNVPLHSAPLSLNLMNCALFRALTADNDGNIIVNFDPLPSTGNYLYSYLDSSASLGAYLAVNLSFCVCLIWSFCILFLIEERTKRFKLLQFISGVRIFTFWTATFFYDLLRVAMISSIIVIFLLVFHYINLTHRYALAWYFIVLVVAGMCMISCNYLLSSFCRDPVGGYVAITVFNVFGASSFSTFFAFTIQNYTVKLIDTVEWFFRLFPHYSLCNALVKIYEVTDITIVCQNANIQQISNILENCEVTPNCCDEVTIWNWKSGITEDLSCLLIVTVVSWILLFLNENRVIWRSIMFRSIPDDNTDSTYEEHEARHADDGDATLPDEVMQEQLKVICLRPSDFADKAIICDHVGKRWNNTPVIKRLYLVVERSECFGLIGVHGSGKSTILKILVGDTNMSYGRAFVQRCNVKSDLFEMYKSIGYCPQNDGILEEYTVSEVLALFCLLRGVPRRDVNVICESLAKVLGFLPYYYKSISICSTGIKRRVSCAVAMIGNPAVIYFDEPTHGIDQIGRRLFWNVIYKLHQKGKTIIITSFNVQEFEYLCNRMAVLSGGKFVSIGSAQEFNKYSLGYMLRVKTKKTVSSAIISYQSPFYRLATFVESEFPNSILKDHQGNTYIFQIPETGVSMSQIFEKLHYNSYLLNIDNFTITSRKHKLQFYRRAVDLQNLLAT